MGELCTLSFPALSPLMRCDASEWLAGDGSGDSVEWSLLCSAVSVSGQCERASSFLESCIYQTGPGFILSLNAARGASCTDARTPSASQTPSRKIDSESSNISGPITVDWTCSDRGKPLEGNHRVKEASGSSSM